MILGVEKFRIVSDFGVFEPKEGKFAVDYKFDRQNSKLYSSIITGARTLVAGKVYQDFDIKILDIDINEFDFFSKIRNSKVMFYPHIDNENLKFEVWIKDLGFYYWNKTIYRDAVKFKVCSVMPKNLKGRFHYIIDENWNPIIDENGNVIIGD